MADDATPVEETAVVEEFRIVQLTPPMPLSLAAAIYKAIGDACEEQGYDAVCKQVDGLGTVWARRRISEP